MATIVNARDVKLQATTPRVASISMASNLVLSQSQVTGLGLVVAGTKLVFLEADTQVFQIAKSGTITPSSATLTAKVQNITGTSVLSVVSGTISPTPTLSGGTVNIPVANMTTDTALIRLTTTETGTGTTYTDEITLIKVREGIDSLNGFLTNEAHSITADYLGNPLSYSGAGGTFKVFQGTVDITTLCTFSLIANPNSVTASIGAGTGVYSVTGSYPVGTDLITVTFRATLGSSSIDKTFTLAKSKAGAPGSTGATGATGSTGQRGSRTFYLSGYGSWSSSGATSAATVDGGPVLNDTVTEYTTGFSETRFWNGSSWVVVNAIVDGNLLVNGTVGATKISVTSLSAVSSVLGTVSIPINGYLRTGTMAGIGDAAAGYWLGWESGYGAYTFRIGDFSGGKYLAWNGSSLSIVGAALDIKSATSGARTELTEQGVKVYDSVGTLRVKLGNLA